MAKGRKGPQRKQHDRGQKNFKKASKGQKRNLREYEKQHPVDTEHEEGKKVKRPRKEFNPVKAHESESSDSEQESANPYLELVNSLGLDSGSYKDQLKEKWKEDESEDDDDEDIEEEMEQVESEEDVEEVGNLVNGDAAKTQNKQEGVSDTENDRTTETHSKDSLTNENVDDDSGDVDDDDDDDVGDNDDITDSIADDYRKDVVNEESDDDDDEEDDNGSDEEKSKGKSSTGTKDPFTAHFEQDLDDGVEKHLSNLKTWQQKTRKIPSFGSVTEIIPSAEGLPTVHINFDKETTFTDLMVKARLGQAWQAINNIPGSEGMFTPLQQDLFGHINSYQDLFYSNRTFQNGDEIRRLYCLHAVNHILKTRSRVVKNTTKIVQSWKDKKDIGEQRDQGLTRPKIVILVPFRDAALKVVEVLMELICGPGGDQVMNKKRFYDEFSEKEDSNSSKDFRSDDFKQMFAGNIDDCFRLGISVMKKSMKLYAKFYAADIIVASPLGLRTIIGNQGEKSYEFDFLSSIEVVIADQTDVFLMQNWEHVLHIFEHFHRQPKDSHDVDFSRVRMWCLNGWSKYYRQTLIFSSFVSPEMNSLFNRHCYNFAGKVKVSLSDVPGSICQVAVQVPQAFHRFECSSFSEAADKRFHTFVNEILPEFKGSLMGHTAIFVPSYFDFVRLRNYFKREAIECAQISEYSQPKEIQRARTYFQQGKRPFLLFTERFYFFFRYRIRGIKNIIFYELPHYSTFYTEILNYMDTRKNRSDSQTNPVTCTVLYTKSNALRLAGVVGSQRCSHMISSDKQVYMLVTGGDEDV
ncbi:U3 small nucleolar RNA-associated protein 25 homolog [Oculina patagonica]